MARTSSRAAQGAGTIRKKTVTRKGKEYTYWEARITIGHDPGTGKQVQRSFTGQTQKEVREKMQAAAVAINNGEYFEPSKMTVSEWLDIWEAEYMGDKKWSTSKTYKANIATHIKPALGAIKLAQLAPHMIQTFYNTLLKSGRTVPKRDKDGKVVKKDGKTVTERVPLNAKTVRNIHGTLTKALSVAVSVGYLRSNPADRVTLPRVDKKEIQPLTDDLVKEFLKVASEDEYEIILKVILFTGLRESEAMGLTWDCVDFKAGTLNICKQLQKRPLAEGGFVFTSLKNNKTRILRPAPFVMELLKRRQQEQDIQRLQAGPVWEGWSTPAERKTALVFTTATGSHLSPQTVYLHYKRLAAKIGVPESRLHDLRHTFAVLSLQNGDNVKTVQGNLGHATAAFTLDVYGHVSERMKEESASRMQSYIDALG